jgi:hypothetical protein
LNFEDKVGAFLIIEGEEKIIQFMFSYEAEACWFFSKFGHLMEPKKYPFMDCLQSVTASP